MHSKRRVREFAVQVLFLWDANGAGDTELAERALKSGTVLDTFAGGGVVVAGSGSGGAVGGSEDFVSARVEAMDMARGAWLEREVTDKRLEFHAPQWPVKRQPGVDRAILRLAVWELGHTKTSPKIVMDEAIELARQFSTEQSPAFVNGVLDAIHKEHRALLGGGMDIGGAGSGGVDGGAV